ncbi:hypothetical protein HK097_006818, partial [Rhizophlyctis rosea]
ENLQTTGQEIQARLDRQREEDRLRRERESLKPDKNVPSMASRKGAVHRRLAALGMLPNSVVASEVGAGVERKKAEVERRRRKVEEEEKAEHDVVWEKVRKGLDRRKAVAAEARGLAEPTVEAEKVVVPEVVVEGENVPPQMTEAEKKELAAKRDALAALAKAEAGVRAEKANAVARSKAEAEAQAVAKVRAESAAKEAVAFDAAAEDAARKRAVELMAQASERVLRSREKTPITGTTFEERVITETPMEEITFATVKVEEIKTGIVQTNFGPTKATAAEVHTPKPTKPQVIPQQLKDRQTMPQLRDEIGIEAPRPKPRRRAPPSEKPPQRAKSPP